MQESGTKKKIHDEIEEHHKKIQKMTEEASNLLSRYKAPGAEKDLKIFKTEKTDSKSAYVTRVKSGVKGLDELVEGGFPEKSLILLTGTTGTGKSIFAMEFLMEGANNGEPGVYISLQESMEETMQQMRFFGWPVDKLVEDGKLLIVQPELYNFDALMTAIEDAIDRINAKRLVIDSISIIGMYFEKKFKIRKSLLEIAQLLKKLDCTCIAISEIGEGEIELSPFGIEEYIADAVIILYYAKKGSSFIRAMTIRKMRTTRHSTKIHPIEIRRNEGIVVYPTEEVFSTVW